MPVERLNPDERRRRLILEASRLFGSRGFDGTSLDDVAQADGIRKQTLLYYFPNKDALFNACIDELGDRLAATLRAGLMQPTEGWERVESVIRSIFRLAEEWPQFPLLAREATRHSPQVVERVAAKLEPLRKRAIVFLGREMREGRFRTQDPGLLLFTLYGAVVGSLTEAGVLRVVTGEDSSSSALRQREEELIEFVKRALVPPPE
ncbi:MAG TPA: TetR/AcrR family transcriptional regulator [Actinomycetota bacterium]|nr:TetR/AcrR family transcriptional regulator [Actinomycetota bacterium]